MLEVKTVKLKELQVLLMNTRTEIKNHRRKVGYLNDMNECREKVADLKPSIDSEMLSGIFFNSVKD